MPRRLVEDTAWHPVTKEELVEWKGTFKGRVFKAFLGSPLKSWASVGHWLIYHFDLKKYSQKQQDRVMPPSALTAQDTARPPCERQLTYKGRQP